MDGVISNSLYFILCLWFISMPSRFHTFVVHFDSDSTIRVGDRSVGVVKGVRQLRRGDWVDVVQACKKGAEKRLSMAHRGWNENWGRRHRRTPNITRGELLLK
jgi:hypothetical protein